MAATTAHTTAYATHTTSHATLPRVDTRHRRETIPELLHLMPDEHVEMFAAAWALSTNHDPRVDIAAACVVNATMERGLRTFFEAYVSTPRAMATPSDPPPLQRGDRPNPRRALFD
jgi:hypothetical protein